MKHASSRPRVIHRDADDEVLVVLVLPRERDRRHAPVVLDLEDARTVRVAASRASNDAHLVVLRLAVTRQRYPPRVDRRRVQERPAQIVHVVRHRERALQAVQRRRRRRRAAAAVDDVAGARVEAQEVMRARVRRQRSRRQERQPRPRPEREAVDRHLDRAVAAAVVDRPDLDATHLRGVPLVGQLREDDAGAAFGPRDDRGVVVVVARRDRERDDVLRDRRLLRVLILRRRAADDQAAPRALVVVAVVDEQREVPRPRRALREPLQISHDARGVVVVVVVAERLRAKRARLAARARALEDRPRLEQVHDAADARREDGLVRAEAHVRDASHRREPSRVARDHLLRGDLLLERARDVAQDVRLDRVHAARVRVAHDAVLARRRDELGVPGRGIESARVAVAAEGDSAHRVEDDRAGDAVRGAALRARARRHDGSLRAGLETP